MKAQSRWARTAGKNNSSRGRKSSSGQNGRVVFFFSCLRVSKARREGPMRSYFLHKICQEVGFVGAHVFQTVHCTGNASVVVREMQGKKAGDRQPRVTVHTICELGCMGSTLHYRTVLPVVSHLL